MKSAFTSASIAFGLVTLSKAIVERIDLFNSRQLAQTSPASLNQAVAQYIIHALKVLTKSIIEKASYLSY